MISTVELIIFQHTIPKLRLLIQHINTTNGIDTYLLLSQILQWFDINYNHGNDVKYSIKFN